MSCGCQTIDQGALVLLHVAPCLQVAGYLGPLHIVALGYQTQKVHFKAYACLIFANITLVRASHMASHIQGMEK